MGVRSVTSDKVRASDSIVVEVMRILLIHDHYRTSAPSGENSVFANESSLLEAHGETVQVFERHNDDIDAKGIWSRAAVAKAAIWSSRSYRDLREAIRRFRPDVSHFHNTFPLISSSGYWACRHEDVPVVQTLHNYRLFCANGLFLRDGKPCEDCVTHDLSRALRYRCYRSSLTATSSVVAMLGFNRAIGSYTTAVDRYIALTEFAARKFVQCGIPASKITIKPNFIPDPPSEGRGDGGYVAFVGRMSEEKGVRTLLEAWRHNGDIRLEMAGDGPLRGEVEETARKLNLNIGVQGRLARDEVIELLSRARLLIVPSEWYEGFPMVVVEAFACGTPIVVSRVGSLTDLAIPGETGATFVPANVSDLNRTVRQMLQDRDALVRLRQSTRRYFESALTAERNYERLMSVYAEVAGG